MYEVPSPLQSGQYKYSCADCPGGLDGPALTTRQLLGDWAQSTNTQSVLCKKQRSKSTKIAWSSGEFRHGAFTRPGVPFEQTVIQASGFS